MIFCGSGATAAVNKLVGILELRRPEQPPEAERPVVFVGPYEHPSNELPWRESIADVMVIDEAPDGHIDLARLEAGLRQYADRPLRIGSCSAASNVTGILTDADRIARLLHAHGALSFWDYAAAAPYVPIRLKESEPGMSDHKGALFLSPHKFVGGPQTPGVLVVRRELIRSRVPTAPGGGTVASVDPLGHRYLDDPVAREEGGTPAIVESIRAGLVFALKQAVGTDTIQAAEERHWRETLAAGTAIRGSRSSATTMPGGCPSSLSASVTAITPTCTTTMSSPCSTTCSASRPVAAARAPDRTAIACLPSTRPPGRRPHRAAGRLRADALVPAAARLPGTKPERHRLSDIPHWVYERRPCTRNRARCRRRPWSRDVG
ncbi:aminotransferase class V-fold PLP-dependent enzyme [Streptomyces montanus]|uniref:aminotransferase class V-fold PLP-dependent enzyme n=1 Tax=Streptomyces montanus TaxID=2580423 RepID=UPI001FEB5A0D|nr:aminotransferase class V-fold PLP-dependent enzyme [Streptomyces montanus]